VWEKATWKVFEFGGLVGRIHCMMERRWSWSPRKGIGRGLNLLESSWWWQVEGVYDAFYCRTRSITCSALNECDLA
jgi:hypothetical protein